MGETKMVQELAASGEDPPARYVAKEDARPIDDSLPLAPIPIVDLSRLFQTDGDDAEAVKLNFALRSWGMFQAVGHDMSPSFLDEMLNLQKEFFQLPLEVKQKYSNLAGGEFSYEGYGNDQVVTEGQILDWTDRLYLLVQPEDKRKLAYWPDTPSSFREILHEFTMKMRKVADQLHRAMAKLLELNDNYFTNQFGETATVYARFNYYPPCSRPNLVNGIKPHTDASTFTIILPDQDVEGLQIVKDGEWVKVTTIPHALLINLGDQMEISASAPIHKAIEEDRSMAVHNKIMSNGIFKSPLHRVVTNSEKDRISIAMFYAIEPEKEIEPADGLVDETRPRLYKKVNVKEYLEVFFQNFLRGSTTINWAKI